VAQYAPQYSSIEYIQYSSIEYIQYSSIEYIQYSSIEYLTQQSDEETRQSKYYAGERAAIVNNEAAHPNIFVDIWFGNIPIASREVRCEVNLRHSLLS